MLDIISVGPGEAVLLTDDAKQAIDRADAVWCAARHAVLVPPEKARPLSPLEGAIEQMRLSSDAGQSAAVLVSGDAGLFHTFMGIPAILAGILTQLSLYSINLRILGGKANMAVSVNNYPLIVSARNARAMSLSNPFIILAALAVAVKLKYV